MDYEKLRKYQRKEKNTAKLVELKEGFYSELSDLVSEERSKYKEEMDPNIKQRLENIKKIARDLYKKRERKIVSRALRTMETEKNNYPLLEREKKLFEGVRKAIQEEREQIERVLKGESLKTREEEPSETTEAEEETETEEITPKPREKEEEPKKATDEEAEQEQKGEGLNKVMVKILKEVPEFVSQNLQKLGPYEPESTVKVPEKEAEILVGKGLAEKTDQQAKEGEKNETT